MTTRYKVGDKVIHIDDKDRKTHIICDIGRDRHNRIGYGLKEENGNYKYGKYLAKYLRKV